MAAKTRTFVYQEKWEDPKRRGAGAYYAMSTNTFTVIKRPDNFRGPQDAERFNSWSHSEAVAVHEQKHQDNVLAGMYEYALSPEQAYKINMHDEISANIAELIDIRKQYLETGDINVFKKNKWPAFKFYYDALVSGEINPRSNNKEDFDREMSLIANGTRDMWVQRFGNGFYLENNSNIGAHLSEINGKNAQYYNQNYERARKIAYGNIGGVDFTKYMEGDVEIPPKGKELLDKKVAEVKKHGRPGKFVNFNYRNESNPPVNYVNRGKPRYRAGAELHSREIPDMRSNIIEQPTMSRGTPEVTRTNAGGHTPQNTPNQQGQAGRGQSGTPTTPAKPADNQGKPETEDKKEKIDINDANVDYALRAVPAYVQDFMKVNGMLDEGHEWMNTRQLKEFLSTAEFTKEQAETLNGYLKDKEARKAEFNAYMRDKTKKSMKETYAEAAKAKKDVPVAVDVNTKKLEERNATLEKEKAELAAKNEALRKERAARIAKAPLKASIGKARVVKDNGKTKEKDAIILKREDGKTYTVTKDMVKDARDSDNLGKKALPSWSKLKDVAEAGGYVSPDIVKSLFNENGEPKYGKYKEVKAVDSVSKIEELMRNAKPVEGPIPDGMDLNSEQNAKIREAILNNRRLNVKN